MIGGKRFTVDFAEDIELHGTNFIGDWPDALPITGSQSDGRVSRESFTRSGATVKRTPRFSERHAFQICGKRLSSRGSPTGQRTTSVWTVAANHIDRGR